MFIAFGIGCVIRLVPAVTSFPYPIGYDTINYYLPHLYNFENSWTTLIFEFPIYISIVYLFSLIFSTDIYYSFLISNIILYGFFSLTIYLLSNKIMNQSSNRSLIFTVFVIFQLGTLRISWDLFRDLFSLSMFNIFLLLIYNFNKKYTFTHFFSLVAIFSVSLVAIFSDRMIGMLLIMVSFIFSFIYKQKYLFLINAFFISSFLFYFLTFDKTTFVSNDISFLDILINPLYDKNTFSTFDISILFLSLYGLLIPFFITGFIFTKFKDNLLIIKIPIIITFIFSYTWIFIPNYSYLVPERWMIIFGVYMSLIAIYGFFLIIDDHLGLRKNKIKKIIIFFFLFAFVIYGFLFTVMPYGVTFSIPSFFQDNTGFIFPLSMMFNTLEIKNNHEMVKSIDWISSNTSNDSIIIGSKHWRGWFSLFLHGNQEYLYSENFVNVTNDPLNSTQINNFLLTLEKKLSNLCTHENYKNNTSLYFIDFNKRYDIPLFPFVVYHSKNFIIYNLTTQICK